MVKKCILTQIVICAVFTLAACGKAQGQSVTEAETLLETAPPTGMFVTEHQLPLDIDLTAVCAIGDSLLTGGTYDDGRPALVQLNAGGNATAWDMKTITASIVSMCTDSGGTVHVLTQERGLDGEAKAVVFSCSDGEISEKITLEGESLRQGELLSLTAVDGKYCVLMDRAVEVFDKDGTHINSICLEGEQLFAQCPFMGGLALCGVSVSGGDEEMLGQIYLLEDVTDKELHPYYSKAGALWTGLGTDTSGNLLVGGTEGLGRLDQDGAWQDLCTWEEGGAYNIYPRQIFRFGDVHVFNSLGSDSIFTIQYDQKRTQRTQLTVLTRWPSETLTALVADYNRSSSDFYIKIEEYDGEDTDRLRARLLSDNCPDIIASGLEQELKGLNSQEVFADLYEYMDRDEAFDRDSLLPSLATAMEEDGGLYQLPVEFMVQTCIVPEIKGIAQADSLLDLMAWAKEYESQAPTYPKSLSREELWMWLSSLTVGDYVDEDSLSCSFDSEGYIRLLEQCSEAKLSSEDDIGQPLLYLTQMGNYLRLSAISKAYDGRYNYVCEASAFQPTLSLSICLGSDNKDAAWDFLRTSLGAEGPYTYSSDFPASEARLDRYLELGIDNNLEYAGVSVSFSKEDAAKLKELFSDTHTLMGRYAAITEIQRQEAVKYFNGQVTAGQAAEQTQSRASIYMAERYG